VAVFRQPRFQFLCARFQLPHPCLQLFREDLQVRLQPLPEAVALLEQAVLLPQRGVFGFEVGQALFRRHSHSLRLQHKSV